MFLFMVKTIPIPIMLKFRLVEVHWYIKYGK